MAPSLFAGVMLLCPVETASAARKSQDVPGHPARPCVRLEGIAGRLPDAECIEVENIHREALALESANVHEVRLSNVNVGQLSLRAPNLEILRTLDAKVKVGELLVRGGDKLAVALRGVDVASATFQVPTGATSISFEGNVASRLVVEGSGVDGGRLDAIDITLIGGQRTSPHFPPSVWIRNVAVNRLAFAHESGGHARGAEGTRDFQLDIADVNVAGELLVTAADSLNGSVQLRSVECRGRDYGTASLHLGGGALVLEGVGGWGEVRVGAMRALDTLALRRVSTRELVLGLPCDRGCQDVRLGSLDVADGVEGESEALLCLARANRSEKPWEVESVYRLLERKAFGRGKEGVAPRPGLRALEESRLREMATAPLLQRLQGLALYQLTGLGCNALVAIRTWCLLWAAFTVAYCLAALDRNAEGTLTRRLGRAALYSLASSLSLGNASRERVDAMVGAEAVGVSTARRQWILYLGVMQGIVTLVQLTLCSIFFSQTTLRI